MPHYNLTDDELAILSAAAPEDTLLPADWWARFLSLFLGRTYTAKHAGKIIAAFNARNLGD